MLDLFLPLVLVGLLGWLVWLAARAAESERDRWQR